MRTPISFTSHVLVVLILTTLATSAQGSLFHALEGKQAPTQNSIYCMLQADDGLLWFGTLGGLHVYDGLTTRRIGQLAPGQEIESDRISALLQDSTGNIWVGGTRGGLDRLNLDQASITHFSKLLRLEYGDSPYPIINCLAEGPFGLVWVGTSKGLYRIDPEQETATMVSGFLFSLSQTPAIRSMETLSDGSLVVSLDHSIVRLTMIPDSFDLDVADWRIPLASNLLTTLSDDQVWVFTEPGHLGRLHLVDGEMKIEDVPLPTAVADWHITTMVGDPASELWIISKKHAVARWSQDSGVTILEKETDTVDHQNFLQHIISMMMDRSGVVWFGTSIHGIHAYSPSTARFRSYTLADDRDGILSDDYFLNIEPVGDGRALALNQQELIELDLNTGRSKLIYRPRDDDQKAMNDEYMLSLHVRPNEILLGTLAGKIIRLSRKNHQASYAAGGFLKQSNPRQLWHIHEDPQKTLWMCFKGETRRFNSDLSFELQLIPELDKLLNQTTVRAIHSDSDGITWFGTLDMGLIRYDETNGTVHQITLNEGETQAGIRGLYRQAKTLWVGTYRGLYRLDLGLFPQEEIAIQHWSGQDGMPDGTIYDILPGLRGELWLSSNVGLVHFDPHTGQAMTYDSVDGLAANEFNGGAASTIPGGWLAFGGIDGLSWFQPGTLYSNQTAPQQTLLVQSSQGEELPFVKSGATHDISWRRPHFTFSIAVLDYQQPVNNSVRYRMSGLDETWHFAKPGDINHFPKLPEGRTVLEYQAANNDGVWSQPGSLTILCAPPPWRSISAKIGYAVLAMLSLGTVVLIVRRRRERQDLLVQRLTHADKLQAVGQMAGGMAHDFNNYLQVIIGESELVSMDLPDNHGAQESLGEIRKACDRARSLARRMLSLSRNPEGVRTVQDIVSIVREMKGLLKSIVGEGVELDMDYDERLVPVLVDEKQIGHILTNLCINARDAMDDKGDVFISIRQHDLRDQQAKALGVPSGPYAWLTVTDSGPGVPPELKQRIFEPFFTTKEQDKGTGLGLSTVFNVVQQHGGVIELDDGPGGGARFSILFPVSVETIFEPAIQVEDAKDLQGHGELILLADDDAQVRNLMVRTLTDAGYRVIETVDGADAIERLREVKHVDTAVLDVIMPKKNGRDVHDFMQRMGLDAPVVFSTGYSAHHLVHEGLDPDKTQILHKPYRNEDLLRAVKQSLNRIPAEIR